jgi:GAF domain-containing protein
MIASTGVAAQRPTLDRLAAAVATLLEVPLVLFTLVYDGRVDVVGAHGLVAPKLPDQPSALCREVALSRRPILVQDAKQRLSEQTRRGWELELVAYAGVPLPLGDGTRRGALIAFLPVRRAWQGRDVHVLRSFAETAAALVDMQARYDELAKLDTNVVTRRDLVARVEPAQ